jgi:zinc transporter ZupT
MTEIVIVALVGLATTSSAMAGAAIGLYCPLSKRSLACILAFAAGALISALAIDLAYQGAVHLHHAGFSQGSSWAFIGGGFAAGAVIYYCASRYLEKKGGAVRFPTRFREYAIERKQEETRDLVKLLSKCDLLRHMPAQAVEDLLPAVHTRRLAAGEVLFRAGDPGDALFIVAKGRIQIKAESGSSIAELGDGETFGEMALLSGGARTATAVPLSDVELLEIDRANFDRMLANDGQLARTVQRLSHDRALKNLSQGVPNPGKWASVAISNVQHLSHAETTKLLTQAGHGAGMAIIMGNILDTIPGCVVIGANFRGLGSLSLTLMLGMFLGGIPEAAASAAMLTRAGFKPKKIFGLWSTVLVAGILAAAIGKAFISSPESLVAIFCEALAGGAVLALVAHAMIPEAIHEGGSLIVLPTVAGFLFALYLSLSSVVFV